MERDNYTLPLTGNCSPLTVLTAWGGLTSYRFLVAKGLLGRNSAQTAEIAAQVSIKKFSCFPTTSPWTDKSCDKSNCTIICNKSRVFGWGMGRGRHILHSYWLFESRYKRLLRAHSVIRVHDLNMISLGRCNKLWWENLVKNSNTGAHPWLPWG